MADVGLILLAAGRSERFGGRDKKVFTEVAGRAVWLHSLARFSAREDVCQIVVAIAPDDEDLFDVRYRANLAFAGNTKVVHGGATRTESMRRALAALDVAAVLVAVHDAARPCVTADTVDRVFQAARDGGAAIVAKRCTDTLKEVDAAGRVVRTVPRDGLWQAQTPQVFRRDWLEAALGQGGEPSAAVTDDSMLLELAGRPVTVVEADAENVKVTTAGDLAVAEAVLVATAPKAKRAWHPFAEEQGW